MNEQLEIDFDYYASINPIELPYNQKTKTGLIEEPGGRKLWYLNGKRHREGGPAIICANGSQYWYLNGQLHREDGPAIISANGDQYWYLNGQEYNEEKYWKL